MRGALLVLLVSTSVAGCSYIGEPALEDRMDLDGDGVPRPEDCDDSDPDVGAAESLFFDGDGDGYGSDTPAESCEAVSAAVGNSADCDDLDPDAHPGGLEVCDGADNDCSGTVDDVDDPPIWYVDADDDGYGNAQAATLATCDQPSGYVDNGDDCDDLNAGAFPGNKEVCDQSEVDDDCSGAADDADPNVDPDTQITVYRDDDGDGFGVDEITELACHAGEGWALESGDCDDADAERHPDNWWYRDRDEDGYGDEAYGVRSCEDVDGYVRDDQDCDDGVSIYNPAGQEVCDELDLDEDCDGLVDDDDATVSGQLTIYEDVDGDGFGDDATETLACDLWSGWVLVGGDCSVLDGTHSPVSEELCDDGLDNDCDSMVDCDDVSCAQTLGCGYYDLGLADLVATGSSADGLGEAVGFLGDWDGDGIGELVVGARGNSSTSLGGAYIVSGATTGSIDVEISSLAFLEGENAHDYAGQHLRGAGDLDGDGAADLVISAPFDDEGGGNAGAVYLVHGPLTGTHSLATATAKVLGPSGYQMGRMIEAGPDFTEDGVGDLLIETSGDIYVVPGDTTGTHAVTDVMLGPVLNYSWAVAVAGDVDGDGSVDLLGGGMGAQLVYGPISVAGGVSHGGSLTYYDSVGYGNLGSAVAAGDADGDGLADVLIGAPDSNSAASNAGAAYLFSGAGLSSLDPAVAQATLLGSEADDEAGSALAVAEDIDGDGFGDLVIGAPRAWLSGDVGRVFIVFGPVSGTVSLADADAVLGGRTASDCAGSELASEDIDGDGQSDLLVGAWHDGDGSGFLLLGNNF
jgi:hypothetical protein